MILITFSLLDTVEVYFRVDHMKRMMKKLIKFTMKLINEWMINAKNTGHYFLTFSFNIIRANLFDFCILIEMINWLIKWCVISDSGGS